MKLIKSIFWLSFAFVALGPQVNAVEAVNELSRQTISSGSQLIAGHINQIECTDLACAGGKLAVSSTLNQLQETSSPANSGPHLPDNIPFPRPRLDRT